jgi:hypothetical protein
MSDAPHVSGHTWRYRFTRPDGIEIETRDLDDDAAAGAVADELSKTQDIPVIVHRHSGHVDAWEYVIEADERE